MMDDKLFFKILEGAASQNSIRDYFKSKGIRVRKVEIFKDQPVGNIRFQKEEDCQAAWAGQRSIEISEGKIELIQNDSRSGISTTETPFTWFETGKMQPLLGQTAPQATITRFFNPYNFVDVSDYTPRYPFTPHDRFVHHTGRICCSITFETPAFIPDPERTFYLISDETVRHEDDSETPNQNISSILKRFIEEKRIIESNLPFHVLFNPALREWKPFQPTENYVRKWTKISPNEAGTYSDWLSGYISPLPEGNGYCLMTETPGRLAHRVMDFCQDQGRPMIPPATLKGMLRARIEALSNSCFPGYETPEDAEGVFHRVVPTGGPPPQDITGLRPVILKRKGQDWFRIDVNQAKVLSPHIFNRIYNTGENKLAVYQNPDNGCYEKISVRGTDHQAIKGLYKYIAAKHRHGVPEDIQAKSEIEAGEFAVERIKGILLSHPKNKFNKTFAFLPWLSNEAHLWAIVRKTTTPGGYQVFTIKRISRDCSELENEILDFKRSETKKVIVEYAVSEIRIKTSFDIDTKTQHRAFFRFGEKDLEDGLNRKLAAQIESGEQPLDPAKIAQFNSLLRQRKANAQKLRSDPAGINRRLAQKMPERVYNGMPAFYHSGFRYLTYTSVPQRPYRHAAADILARMDKLPCHDRNHLCPACNMFGTANLKPQGQASDRRRKDALAGKISISPGRFAGDDLAETPFITLKSLGTPKPTYYPFYLLNNRGARSDRAAFVDYDGNNLKIGRKVYLSHQEEFLDYTATKRSHLNASVRLIPKGAEFCFQIDFENLNNYELGLLLYSLTAVYKGESLPFRLGMGKSLGLGTCSLRIEGIDLLNPLERYTSLTDSGIKNPSNEEISKRVYAYQYVQGAPDMAAFQLRLSEVNAGENTGLETKISNKEEVNRDYWSRQYIKEYHLLLGLNRHQALKLGAPISYALGFEKGFEWYQKAKNNLKERLFDPDRLEGSIQNTEEYCLSLTP